MTSVLKNIPEKWWGVVSNHFSDFPNDTIDFNRPYIRKSFQTIYPVIIFFYAIVILLGASTNIAMLTFIMRHRLFKDPIILFLGNEALSNIIKCIFLLPINLCYLLLHNWVFGYSMCFFLPMLQQFPFYVSMLTFILIVVSRYQFIQQQNTKFNDYSIYSILLVIATWIISVCITLPHAFLMHYFEVGSELSNASICIVDNFKKQKDTYCYTIISIYVIPLPLVLYFYLRTLLVINKQIKTKRNEPDNASIGSSDMETSFNSDVITAITQQRMKKRIPFPARSVEEFNPIEEKRTQKYICIIILAFLLYVCPVNILYFVTQIPNDDYDNQHFSLVYVTLVLLSFVPSCITPALFTAWIIKRPIMNQIYFFWTTNILGGN